MLHNILWHMHLHINCHCSVFKYEIVYCFIHEHTDEHLFTKKNPNTQKLNSRTRVTLFISDLVWSHNLTGHRDTHWHWIRIFSDELGWGPVCLWVTAAAWRARKRPAAPFRRPVLLGDPPADAHGRAPWARGKCAALWLTCHTTRVCWAERCTVGTHNTLRTYHTRVDEISVMWRTLTFSRLCTSAGYFMPCSLVAAAMREIHSCVDTNV